MVLPPSDHRVAPCRLRQIIEWAQLALAWAGKHLSGQPVLLDPTSCHRVVVFILPLLGQFLGFKFEGKDLSPFETHPNTMRFFVLCLLAYCFAYGLHIRLSSSAAVAAVRPSNENNILIYICANAMLLFASLSLASLSSLFFPDSLRWLFYLLFIFLSTAHVLLYALLLHLPHPPRAPSTNGDGDSTATATATSASP